MLQKRAAIVVACLMLCGCTTLSATVVNTPSPQSTALPSIALATSAPLATSGTPTIQGIDCGTVHLQGPNPPTDPAAAKAEDCIWQAFQQCQTATFIVTEFGVDAGRQNTFVIQKNGARCGVTYASQTFMVPQRVNTPETGVCDNLIKNDRGLVFVNCASAGDINVPAPK